MSTKKLVIRKKGLVNVCGNPLNSREIALVEKNSRKVQRESSIQVASEKPICNVAKKEMYIQVDWLQINCRSTSISGISWNKKYTVNQLSFGSRQFSVLESVKEKGKEIAIVARLPYSSVIDPNTILIKFSNDFLYCSGLKYNVSEFLALNGLQLRNISRLDICHDFTEFSGGLLPSVFIRRFLHQDIIKTNKQKFTLTGSHDRGNIFNYLKFGSNTSPVRVYLYNKTQEMADVKLKPYIIDEWRNLGVDVGVDVWRLEFSMDSTVKELHRYDTGEIINFKTLDMLDQSNLFTLYGLYLKKYFTFKINGSDKNISRLETVVLFENMCVSSKIVDNSKKISSNRADKIFIKKVKSLVEEVGFINIKMSFDLNEFFEYFVKSRGLIDWTAKKLDVLVSQFDIPNEYVPVYFKD